MREADIRTCCTEIKNGFSVEQNLYHILEVYQQD